MLAKETIQLGTGLSDLTFGCFFIFVVVVVVDERWSWSNWNHLDSSKAKLLLLFSCVVSSKIAACGTNHQKSHKKQAATHHSSSHQSSAEIQASASICPLAGGLWSCHWVDVWTKGALNVATTLVLSTFLRQAYFEGDLRGDGFTRMYGVLLSHGSAIFGLADHG